MATTAPLQGIAVSPGVAIATARCLIDIPLSHAGDAAGESSAVTELESLDAAFQRTVAELQELQQKVTVQVGTEEAAIFQAHITIAEDTTLLEKVRSLITEQGRTAMDALRSVMDEYEQLFSGVDDAYLRERLVDVRDVLGRVACHVVRSEDQNSISADEPVVLVVHELLPSDVVTVSEKQIVGIATQSGGRTSHAAILARSYGIPAVAGVAGILAKVNCGDTVVLDGTAGRVFVNPGDEVLRAYGKRRREFLQLRKTLASHVAGPAITKDGEQLELLANISCAADAAEANQMGAAGIGLYRTEFFYLTHSGIPTEDEETAEYKAVLDSSPQGPVTIRTLDLGGDKTIPFLTHASEANPFLGWRSIRLSFEHPDMFLRQIRAVYRAAHGAAAEIRLLFPMITTIEELEQIHSFTRQARETLRESSRTYGEVKVGMMVEVPAAAVMIDDLLELVDFVSVGSNDLVQYLTAADRDNPKVSHLCQALSPAVLRVVNDVIGACCAAQKPVSVCGEMAGSPRAFPLLLGMGLRSFSMSSSFIPIIHALAKCVSISDARSVLTSVLSMKTAGEIQRTIDDFVLMLCPELKPYLIA